MGHTFYQHDGHLVFRADGVPIRSEDLPRLHAYLGGVARNLRIGAAIIGRKPSITPASQPQKNIRF